MRLEFTRPPEWPELRAGRFATSIRFEPEGCRVALLGLPDDLGVRLNGGRVGAAAGPAAFRQALAHYGTAYDALRERPLSSLVFDAGDVMPALGEHAAVLEETHHRAECATDRLHELDLIVVGIGGGHDLSLPTISSLSRAAQGKVGGIVLDAHLDVRERAGSGMPFRSLVQRGALDPRCFAEVGIARFANDADDLAWAHSQGIRTVYASEWNDAQQDPAALLGATLARTGAGFLSIDLDGIDQSQAPGVSAPNPSGLSVRTAARFAEAAGRQERVRHFDIMELCPPHDPSNVTARVAAYLFLCFIAGLEGRGE